MPLRRLATTVVALLVGCSDPPPPPPVPTHVATVAPWVRWRDESDPVGAPIAVFVDARGGPADRIAADLDVTTFLNDRFHPVLVPAYEDQPIGTIAFYDAAGCRLAGPYTPANPQELIDRANELVVRVAGRTFAAPRLPTACHSSPG